MRPEIVGHAPVIAQLEAAARDGALPHASLLTGPEGVGKTTVAEHLAAAVLDADRWPGGLRAHPDHWLEDSPAERIGIDRVRAGGRAGDGPSLQDFLALRPYAGGARVAVVGRADRLTEQAANCVLKTLEEPPPGTHIVLCAAHPERMPATILSRCMALGLAPVPAAAVAAWLRETHAVDAELAATAAALCGGRPGRALALATAPGALGGDLAAIDALVAAAGSGRAGALRVAGELAPPAGAEGRERALAQVAAWTTFLRDVACLSSGAPELAVLARHAPAARSWAATLPIARLAALLGRCIETTDQLAQYAVPRLAFEVLLLDILAADPAPPRVQLPPPGDGPGGPAAASPRSIPPPRARPSRRR